MPTKIASRKTSEPNKGSVNWHISSLEVGECFIFEARDAAHANSISRKASDQTRKPDSMAGMQFKAETYNACRGIGVFKIFVRVERVEI